MKLVKAFLFFTSIFLTLMFLSFFLLLVSTENKTKKIISPLIDNPTSVKASENKKNVLALTNSELGKIVEDSLSGTKGSYSVVIKNLKSGEIYNRNPDKKYLSASLYKLWLMAAVYEQLEQDKLTKDKELTADIVTLNKKFSISSESAELSDGTISLTVDEAIKRMITYSDNYSALLLSSSIGVSKMAQFLKDADLKDSRIGSTNTLPMTTAQDIARYYELLYKEKLVSVEASHEMKDLLLQQRLNDRIPKYLPKTVKVAHKTGELDGVKHDAGIIYTESGDYILSIMSESSNPQAAAERIAILSKNIFNYFEKK